MHLKSASHGASCIWNKENNVFNFHQNHCDEQLHKFSNLLHFAMTKKSKCRRIKVTFKVEINVALSGKGKPN